jgi:hypothetical protein
MSDIFIGYANADRPGVKPLVDALQQRGWSVWWDRKISIGKTWDQVIDAAFNRRSMRHRFGGRSTLLAGAFIVTLSARNSKASRSLPSSNVFSVVDFKAKQSRSGADH